MPERASQSVSELLAQWRAGDEESLRRLVPLVYNELRRIAHYHLRRERPDHTLQTTALVHEAYLCMMKQEPMGFENRAHFFAVCAQLMRQILVQYARRRNAAKRQGGTGLRWTMRSHCLRAEAWIWSSSMTLWISLATSTRGKAKSSSLDFLVAFP
jgi:RNA polymerase sigma factor (TIGR02999 family)